MRRKLITMVAVATLALSMAACSSGDDDDDESSGTTTTTEETTTTTESTTTTDGGSDTTTSTTSGSGGTTTTTAPQTPTTTQNDCPATRNWDTNPETSEVLSTDPIFHFEAGRHSECYDQLTFELNGTAPVGFSARYASGSDVTDEGGGPIRTVGGAALAVTIWAPNQNGPYDTTGHQPGRVFAPRGEVMYSTDNPRGLRVIEEVISGGEFESHALYAVGTNERHRFSVSTGFSSRGQRVVIVRVAHR